MDISPNHRYGIIGKSRSGKTTFAVVLASTLVKHDDPTWEVWWLDSKHDPKDLAMLRAWGFGRKHSSRRLFILTGDPVWEAFDIANRAIMRRNVLLVVDEYKHVVPSPRRSSPVTGQGIENVHLRGGGLNVGLIGLSQEPVDIPRQLVSQATHGFIFDLSYPADIKWVRELYADYVRPPRGPDGARHGFYHAHLDGEATWRYHPHVAQWHGLIVPEKDDAQSQGMAQPLTSQTK